MKIPKSEPPRLDGNQSKNIKDFVAVCLNDDPNSRPSADELLKHKFIKTAKRGNRELIDLVMRHQKWMADHNKDEDDPDLWVHA